MIVLFIQNGMGNLDISDSGIRLDGSAEFIGPLYAETISTDQVLNNVQNLFMT